MKKKVSNKLLDGLHVKSLQLLDDQNYKSARKILIKLLEIEPDNPINLYNYALTFANCNEFFEAYTLFNNLLIMEISNELKEEVNGLILICKSGYLTHKALDLKNMDEEELPISLLEKALEICPQNNDAKFYLGQIHQKMYEYKKAINYYNDIEKDDILKDQLEVKFNLGQCYLAMDDISTAEKYFAFVLLNDDLNLQPEVHFYFAEMVFRKKEFKKSLQHINNFKNAIDRETENKESNILDYYDHMAKYYRAKISIYEAIGNVKNAVQLAKRYFNLAMKQKMSLDPLCVFTAFGALEVHEEWDYLEFLDKKNTLIGFGHFGLLPMDIYLKAIIADNNGDFDLALDYFIQVKEYVQEACKNPKAPTFKNVWYELSCSVDDFKDFNIPDLEIPFGILVDKKINELKKNIKE